MGTLLLIFKRAQPERAAELSPGDQIFEDSSMAGLPGLKPRPNSTEIFQEAVALSARDWQMLLDGSTQRKIFLDRPRTSHP